LTIGREEQEEEEEEKEYWRSGNRCG